MALGQTPAGEHVLMGQLGKVLQKLSFRTAGRQGPQHVTHGETRAPHARFPIPKRAAGISAMAVQRAQKKAITALRQQLRVGA